MRILMNVIPPSTGSHTATVIFFHGATSSGRNLVEWIRFLLRRDMQFPHIKIMYPTAPLQPFSRLGGQMSNVWFDGTPKRKNETLLIHEAVSELIASENENHIPSHRIVVGGFSMGGTLALHTAYCLHTDLRGVFVCSSWLNRTSRVFECLAKLENAEQKLPELLMFHGTRDPLVPCDRGRESFDSLKKFGIKGEFILLENAYHELKKKQLETLERWIVKMLPP